MESAKLIVLDHIHASFAGDRSFIKMTMHSLVICESWSQIWMDFNDTELLIKYMFVLSDWLPAPKSSNPFLHSFI